MLPRLLDTISSSEKSRDLISKNPSNFYLFKNFKDIHEQFNDWDFDQKKSIVYEVENTSPSMFSIDKFIDNIFGWEWEDASIVTITATFEKVSFNFIIEANEESKISKIKGYRINLKMS